MYKLFRFIAIVVERLLMTMVNLFHEVKNSNET